MKPAPIVLFCLVLTCGTLMVMLAAAWRCFGRPRAALLWSAACGAFTVTWGINLAGVLTTSRWQLWFPAVGLFSSLSALLLVAGFLARSRRRQIWLVPLAIFGMVCLGSTTAGSVLSSDALSDAPDLFFYGVCIAISGTLMRARPGEHSGAERVVAIVFAIITVFYITSAAMAALLSVASAESRELIYRLVILLGIPPAATATGLSCIFLIASDLAEQMQRLAATDPLTSVFNRRGLGQAADALIAICRRQGQPLTVVVADLDHFKAVNDRFGHAAGDQALRSFADFASRSVRRGDLLARLGGEEFGILMPNTSVARAVDAMERLRAGLAALTPDGIAPMRLSASFGVAAVEPGDDGIEPALARADVALYRAKQDGRDCIRLADADEEDATASLFEPVQQS